MHAYYQTHFFSYYAIHINNYAIKYKEINISKINYVINISKKKIICGK